jgi:hypothetical protein
MDRDNSKIYPACIISPHPNKKEKRKDFNHGAQRKLFHNKVTPKKGNCYYRETHPERERGNM